MSKLKIKKYSMFMLLALLAVFIFGCDNKTPVKDIYFAHDEQIVMLVGETVKPNVVVTPSYATNTKYTLTSTNSEVIEILNDSFVAKSEGEATVKVVASGNKLLEDVITVNVRKQPTQLTVPTGLKYSPSTQTFSFNSVNNASGYTMRVNGVEVNLGNSTSLSLENLDKIGINAYDNLLKVELKANAPTYTKALEDSEFTKEFEIYQNGKVEDIVVENAILKFKEKSNADFPAVYDILIDNSLWKNGVAASGIDLTQLDERWAGKDVTISVIARTAGKSSSNGYFSSIRVGVPITVLDTPELSLTDTQLSWAMVSKVGSYSININNEEKEVLNENHIKLEEIDNLEIVAGATYTLSLKVNLPDNSKNIAKTRKVSSLKFNKLQQTTVELANNKIKWNLNSDNMAAFAIKLETDEVLVNTTTLTDSFAMDKYESNKNYKFTIRAIGKHADNGIYYLSSDSTELEFKKNEIVEAKILDYFLKFNAEVGEKYSIKIDEEPEQVITAEAENFEYSLKNTNFEEGLHKITLYKLGNLNDSVDGGTSAISFTQLGRIHGLRVKDSTFEVVEGEFNSLNNATVKICITDGEDYNFSVDVKRFIVEQNMLQTGAYTMYAEIIGDGSSTFSYMKDGEIIKCLPYEFYVLPSPTISLVSKEEQKISFGVLENVVSYELYENGSKIGDVTKQNLDDYFAGNSEAVEYPFVVESETNLNCSFNLAAGKSVNFGVVARGDGIKYFDSPMPEGLTIKRLQTPNLIFDNQTNTLSKEDNNDASEIGKYVLYHNGVEIDLNSWNFGEEFPYLENGINRFLLYVEPKSSNNLTSFTNSLNIEKISNATDISIDANNKLVIMPRDNKKSFAFELEFDCGGTTINMLSDGTHVNYNGHKFAYRFVGGRYVIDSILGEDYLPIIKNFANDFSVRVRFSAQPFEPYAKSDFSNFVDVKVLETATLSREGQYVTFENLNELKSYTDYALLINNNKYIELSETTVFDVDNQIIKVPVTYFEQYATQGVNTVAVVTKNTDSMVNEPTLTSVGEPLSFELEQTPVLVSAKDNFAENNSVVVSFDAYETYYDKSYIVYIYNEDIADGLIKTFVDSEVVDGKISFNLDEQEIEGNIKIIAMVETSHDDLTDVENPIYHFNSVKSNVLRFNKPAASANLAVRNGNLVFDAVPNVVGYEIYEKVDGSYTKISSAIVTSISYSLVNLEGTRELAVKGIAVNKIGSSLQTNTSLSESIKINKIETPELMLYNGDISIRLSTNAINLLQSEDNDCELVLVNGARQVRFKINASSKLVGNNLIIDAHEVLNYGQNSFVKENVKAFIRANSTSETCEVQYVNSNSTMYDVYGLYAPSNAGKTTDSNSESEFVEYITWQTNTKNIDDDSNVLERAYQFKIEYSGTTYYSYDVNLKWFDGSNYVSYPTYISKTETEYQHVVFPEGYDEDGNGSISETEKFGAGSYKVSVRAIPIESATINWCSSKYCADYTFEIMDKLVLTADNGLVSWQENSKATGYLVKVFNKNETEPIITKTITTNTYALDELANGIYGVQVQAINTNDGAILNSEISELVEFYRLPEVTNVYVDDGRLFITADNLFSVAEIEFVDITDLSKVQKINFVNEDVDSNIGNLTETLGANSWSDVDSYTTNPQTYVVSVDKSTILNLANGGSFNINVKLLGNTNASFGIINGNKTTNVKNLITTKLSGNKIFSVSKGVLTFALDTEYVATFEANNNINNQAVADSFLKDAPIFEIEIKASGRLHTIYAIDYNYFENNKSQISNYKIFDSSTLQPGDVSFGDLHAYYIYNFDNSKTLLLNVFKENRINLKQYDYLRYYAVNQTFNEADVTYKWSGVSNENSYTSINLADGGTFDVSVSLLGGDTYNNTSFLTSNIKSSEKFIRYEINSIATNNGLIEFNDLETNVDTPIYKLNFVNSDSETTVVYLYRGTRDSVRDIIGDEGIFITLTSKNYLNGKIRFEMSDYFPADVYNVNIKTLAGVGKTGQNSWDYLLDSKDPETSWTIRQLYEPEVTYSEGCLTFTRGYVDGDEGNEYYDEYEITIKVDGQDKVYTISSISEGVTIDRVNNKVIYDIPDNVYINGRPLPIDSTGSYEIKIRPISTTSGITNAKYIKDDVGADKLLKFKVSTGSKDLAVSNGKLTWTPNSTDDKFIIKLTYKDSSNITRVILINPTETNSYAFTDNTYKVEGANIYPFIESAFDYKVELVSYSTINENDVYTLLSSAQTIASMKRLQTVDNTQIKSLDGVLVWNAVDNASAYEVVISNNYKYITTETSLDLLTAIEAEGKTLPVGEHSIKIRALGDACITAMDSKQSANFIKLGAINVENIQIAEDGNIVSWQEGEDVSAYGTVGYKVIVKYNYNQETGEFEGTEPQLLCTTEFPISQFGVEISGRYQIVISVVSIGEGYMFNGGTVVYESTTDAPESVTDIELNEEIYAYTWSTQGIMTNGDYFVINYKLNDVAQPTINMPYVIGVTDYKFMFETIGVYSEFQVTVRRPGAFSSSTKGAQTYDFNLFKEGKGSNAEPYKIETREQLLNIAKFTDRHYVLVGNITLKTEDIMAGEGGIVAEEFSGSLNGMYGESKYSINFGETGADINISNIANFALFGTLNGAEINNLSIGRTESSTKFVNSVAFESGSVLNLSLIAIEAKNNSIINGVNIKNIDFNLTIAKELEDGVFVAGVVAKLENSTISTVEMYNFNITVGTNISASYTRVAGVVALAKDVSSINNVNAYVNITQTSSNNSNKYVGGIVAQITKSSASIEGVTTVQNSNITLATTGVYATYLGGVAGLTEYAIISNCTANGTYSIDSNIKQTNMGGLVGYASNTELNDVTSNFMFEINSLSGTSQYIGAIVGNLLSNSSINGYTVSENVTVNKTEIANGVISKLGIYGNLVSGL